MISWIQRYFQHHFRTVFALLLGVVIIAFVFTIGAAPGLGRGDRQVVERPFFGYNLSLASDQQKIFGDAQLSIGLQYGSFNNVSMEQIQNYAFHRAASLHLANEWNIPAPGSTEVTEAVKKLRMFSGADGQFDTKAYASFRDRLKTDPRGMTEGDIARVISDDIRVDKVNQLLSGPGYVLPSDVKNQLKRSDTSWTLATATADYASFNPEIKPTDADLTKFFEENSFRYEIPARIVVSHVEFPATQFLGNVIVTEAEVRAFYDANPARFPKPAADPTKPITPGITPPAEPAADFAAVRTQVEAALKLERAQKLATKAASDLTLALFEAKVTDAAALESFLANRKLAPKALAPFTRQNGPVELGGSPEIAEEAFKLSKDRLVSEPVSTSSGSAVLFWKDTEAPRKPLLTEVREKVVADYVENEKRKRFVELGKTIKSQIESRMKSGESFDKAAAAAASAASIKLETKTLPAFTLRSRPQDVDYSVLGALERLDQNQVSDMTISGDKGIFVYAVDKKAPEINDANPRFTEVRNQLASLTARMGGSAYLSDMVEQELKRSEPKVQ